MRTLVAGVGSPILCDDGVGVHVVRALAERSLPEDAEVVELGTAGLSLLDHLERGCERLILVDAIVTGAPPGSIHELTEADVAGTLHLGPGHEADLPTALAIGRRVLGDRMPGEVVIVGVEAADLTSFRETPTPAVARAIPAAAARVAALLG